MFRLRVTVEATALFIFNTDSRHLALFDERDSVPGPIRARFKLANTLSHHARLATQNPSRNRESDGAVRVQNIDDGTA